MYSSDSREVKGDAMPGVLWGVGCEPQTVHHGLSIAFDPCTVTPRRLSAVIGSCAAA